MAAKQRLSGHADAFRETGNVNSSEEVLSYTWTLPQHVPARKREEDLPSYPSVVELWCIHNMVFPSGEFTLYNESSTA